MAPQARKINGPTAIRYLATASSVYQTTIRDVVATIQGAIDEGTLQNSTLAYTKLLMALSAVERDLSWLAEMMRPLVGETP